MNDTIELLRTRRSVPPQLLTGPGPSPEEIETLLALASRVPDHGKLNPWRFVVIGKDAQDRLGDAIARAFASDDASASPEQIEAERQRLSRAPLVIAVVSRARPHAKIPEWEQVMSVGAACMNLIIAANALGYGTSWLTGWIAFDRRILETLGLAPYERIAGFIHIGRATDPVADRPRPTLSEIATYL